MVDEGATGSVHFLWSNGASGEAEDEQDDPDHEHERWQEHCSLTVEAVAPRLEHPLASPARRGP